MYLQQSGVEPTQSQVPALTLGGFHWVLSSFFAPPFTRIGEIRWFLSFLKKESVKQSFVMRFLLSRPQKLCPAGTSMCKDSDGMKSKRFGSSSEIVLFAEENSSPFPPHQGSKRRNRGVLAYLGRRKWQPTQVFLPRESCGQRSLVGCCPWGRTELDTTEATQHACMHWRRKWQPTPVFLPGESQGRRSLVGCCLWGCIDVLALY